MSSEDVVEGDVLEGDWVGRLCLHEVESFFSRTGSRRGSSGTANDSWDERQIKVAVVLVTHWSRTKEIETDLVSVKDEVSTVICLFLGIKEKLIVWR